MEAGVYFFCYGYFMHWRQTYLGFSKLENQWVFWIARFLLADLIYYWFHRLGHEIRLLWANHIVHHSSEHYNFTTSVRISWCTHFFKFLFWSPLAVFGFHPLYIVYVLAIIDAYQYFLHTEHAREFGLLEKILNTPKLHAVHHAKNLQYIDKNYGGVFIIWDRIFGTYQSLLPTVQIEYGVTMPPDQNIPLKVVTHEFVNIWKDLQKAETWKERWMVLFASPAWNSSRFADQKKEHSSIETPQTALPNHQKSMVA